MRYRIETKRFHKKKNAVGLIKFQYVYTFYNGFIVKKDFELVQRVSIPKDKTEETLKRYLRFIGLICLVVVLALFLLTLLI